MSNDNHNEAAPVLGCDRLVRHLSPFQARVLGNMAEGTWYGDIAEDGISAWPEWMFRRTTQPNVTLACLLDAGAIEKRMHTYPNGTRWRVFRRVPNDEAQRRRAREASSATET